MVESFGLLRQKDIVARMIGHLMGNTEYVTDFSEGSIIRSICEAVAEELYSSNVAFAEGIVSAIDTSVKQAFNFPLLQASQASGYYTFYRKMYFSPMALSSSAVVSQKGLSLISGGTVPYANTTWTGSLYYGVSGVTADVNESAASASSISTLDGYNTARLRWFKEDGYTAYNIYRASVHPSSRTSYYTNAGDTSANALVAQEAKYPPVISSVSASAEGSLSASTTYYYSVSSYNSTTGESACSPVVSQATGTSNRTLTVTWASALNDSPTSYYLYRSANASMTGAVYRIVTGTTSHADSAPTAEWTSRTWHGLSAPLVGQYFFSTTAIDNVTDSQLESVGQYPANATYTGGTPVLYWAGIVGQNNVGSYRIYRSIIGTPAPSLTTASGSNGTAKYFSVQSKATLATGELVSSNPSDPASLIVTDDGLAVATFPLPYNGVQYATSFDLYRGTSLEMTSSVKSTVTISVPDAPVITPKATAISPVTGNFYGLTAVIVGTNYETESEIVLFNTSAVADAAGTVFTWTSSPTSNVTKYRLYKADGITGTGIYTTLTSPGYFEITKASSGTTTTYTVPASPPNPTSSGVPANLRIKNVKITESASASRVSATWPGVYYPMTHSYSTIANPVTYALQGATVSWQTLGSSVSYAGRIWPYIHKIATKATAALTVAPSADSSKTLYQYDDDGTTKPVINFGSTTAIGNYFYASWPFTNNAKAVNGDIQIYNGTQLRVPGTSKSYVVSLPSGNYTIMEGNNISVPIRATFSGLSSNTPSNTITEIINPMYGISTGTNLAALTNGRDAETESEWKIRFSSYLKSLSRGTKDSLEEGGKTAYLLNIDGTIQEQVTKSFAVEDGSTTVNLFVHNGTNSSVSQTLLDKTRVIVSGGMYDNVSYYGYKPAGITIIVKAASFMYQNLNVYLTLLGGYSVTSVSDSVSFAIDDYFYTLDISDGFSPSVLGVISGSSASPSNPTPLYRVVLTDSNGIKSFPSQVFSGYDSFSYTIPTASVGPTVVLAEILKWRNYYSDWGLAGTVSSSSGLSSANWYDSNTVDANTLTAYTFSNPLRKYFEKSVLSRSILRIPGVAAVKIQLLDSTNTEINTEVIVPNEGYVVFPGTVRIS